jgi:hypothetical protein
MPRRSARRPSDGAGAGRDAVSPTWSQTVQGTTFTHALTDPAEAVGYSFLDGGVTRVSVSLTLPGFSDSAVVPPGGIVPVSLSVSASARGRQLISLSPGMATATMGIGGALAVRTVLFPNMGTLYKGPLSIGVSGVATHYFAGVFGSYHYATVDFYGWSAHTWTFTGLTSRGQPLSDVVAKGSWGLSPVNPLHEVFGGAGTITLVAPTRITVAGQLPRRSVSLTTLKLSFWSDGPYDTIPVPEPGAPLLAVAGLALLRMASRRLG